MLFIFNHHLSRFAPVIRTDDTGHLELIDDARCTRIPDFQSPLKQGDRTLLMPDDQPRRLVQQIVAANLLLA
jgi:hypothetical protein